MRAQTRNSGAATACKLEARFAACVPQNATFSAQMMVIAAAISHALRLTLQ